MELASDATQSEGLRQWARTSRRSSDRNAGWLAPGSQQHRGSVVRHAKHRFLGLDPNDFMGFAGGVVKGYFLRFKSRGIGNPANGRSSWGRGRSPEAQGTHEKPR
jgi:hypothetical protein